MKATGHRGVWLILAAACLWGTTGTAQALGPSAADPLGVGLMRLVVAAPALVIIAIATGSLPSLSDLPWRPTLLAGIGMAAYQPAFFAAVDRTGVALGTAVAIGSAPILTGLITWVVSRHRPAREWWAATALAVGGVTLLAIAGERIGVDAVGLAAAMGAGLAYAIYVVASIRVVSRAPAIGGTALVFTVAMALSLPLIWLTDLNWVGTASGALMALHLGLVATALAYVLFANGLRTTTGPTAATVSLAEPATATILAVVVLGERLGWVGWVAILLIFAGLWLILRARKPGPVPTLAA
ncbi:MAG: EamA family transporter [Acidimicrobiia bacterium]